MSTLALFLVQAYRVGDQHPWTTDSPAETLDAAIADARKLATDYGRSARVIDQEEQVHFRCGPAVTNGKKAVRGGRAVRA